MTKAIRLLLAMLVLVLTWQASFAQNRLITGTVKDNNGEAIIGSSVLVKGSTTGTYTDVDGNYSLSVPSNATTLVFKYLGYKSKEVPISATNVVNIELEEDVLGLEEVVVTAVGISAEKKSLGYSVQDVSGDKLTAAGANNTLSALSGKVAGLQVINSSGAPGSSVFLQLRGATSITGDNSPLFVIDGIPVDNSYNASGSPDNEGALINNNLLESVNNSNRAIDVNPDDIASITVLKGPAAAALYGLRASNGAIIITTKRGGAEGAGKGMHASFSSTYTVEEVNKLPEMQDKYIKGSGGTIAKYGSTASGSWGALADTLFWDPTQVTPYNQYGELIGQSAAANNSAAIPFTPYNNEDQFFRTGNTMENNLSLSGGGDKGGFRVSFGSLNQKGVVPLSDFQRYSGTLSGEMKISEKFSTAGSITYVKSGGNRVQQGSNLSGLMLDLLRTPISFDNSNGSDDPTEASAYVLDDGSQRNYRAGVGYDNPYWTINQNPFQDDVNRMYGYGEVGWSPWTWLKFTERVGVDFYSDRRNQIFAINSRATPDGQIFERDYTYRQINNDLLGTASKQFSDKFSGSLTLGFNALSQSKQDIYVQGDNLVIPDFYNFSNAANVLTREYESHYRIYGFYGSLDLSFANSLYLTLTGRNDHSSTLPAENNSFFYPSASLSWVFTEALGLSNNKVFPYGKLRLSVAQVGHDAPLYALENYYAQTTASDGWTSGIAFPLPDANGNATTAYSNSATLGNPGLKPEKVTSFEVGADLRFINNRIGLDVTYYQSKSVDQIIPAPIAGSTGYQQQYLNSGSIENKGFEVALNITAIKTKDWKWDIGANWSTNKSEVLELANGVNELFLGGFEGSAVYAIVGEQYGSIYGSRWLRDDNGNIVIDDVQFLSDGSENPTYGYPIQDAQVGVIGDVNPDWIAGLSTSLAWKGLSISVLMDVRQGGDLWNGTRGALNFFGKTVETENRGETTVFEGVLSDGQTNNIEVPLDQSWYQGLGSGFGGPTEQFIEDGSYIKLRELALTYTIAPKVLEKTPIASIDISLVGRNLWLSTDYKGVDPETSLTGANHSQGMDYFNMPGVRSFGLNLRLTL
ncbi:MAG: SusC/RagA family TonB-linked outer membrane protein [Chitinophagaceae bacterium]|nr:SusC/RagA family TonB-linked outer membrane protein [Chitinophagaceae bacterium]